LFIKPEWPAPINIRALCTTRLSGNAGDNVKGQSNPPYDYFNVATHVGDNPLAVQQNRQILTEQACLVNSPFWLDQQHTVEAVCLDNLSAQNWQPVIADASWSTQTNHVALVMTADCIPLLITNLEGSLVCAIHAGWKGLADGIVSKTIQALPEQPQNLLVWIGPCIRQAHFEVGLDVYEMFCAKIPNNQRFFKKQMPITEGKYFADIAGLLKLELKKIGLTHIYDSELCSYADSERFYSYRRDGATGRMASLIWIED